MTETYFYDDIKQVLNLIHKDYVNDSKIALLSQRFHNNNDSYFVSDLTEILEGVDSEENTSYIFKYQNGKVYIDSLHAEREKEIINTQLIYFKDL